MFTSLSSRSPLRCTTSMRRRCVGRQRMLVRSASASSAGPSSSVSGVRSSWLTLVKKVVLARSSSASCSTALAVPPRRRAPGRSRGELAGDQLDEPAVVVVELAVPVEADDEIAVRVALAELAQGHGEGLASAARTSRRWAGR